METLDVVRYTSRFSSWRMLLGSLFVTCVVGGGLLASKVVLLVGVSLTASALAFPFSIAIIAVVAEVYGYETADRMALICMICAICAAVIYRAAAALPDGISWPGAAGADILQSYAPRFIFVTGVGFLIGNRLCSPFGKRSLRRNGQRGVYVRLFALPLFCQLISTLVIVPGYFAGVLDWRDLTTILVGRLAFAALFGTLAFLPMRRLALYVRASEYRDAVAFSERTASYVTRAQEERSLRLAERISDGIVSIDVNSIVRYANAAMCALTQYRHDELVGRSLTMLMPAQLRPLHLAGVRRYAATKEERIDWDDTMVPLVRKDGTQIIVRVSFIEYYQEGEFMVSGIVCPIQRDPLTEEMMRGRTFSP